jgi:hypothetical protein
MVLSVSVRLPEDQKQLRVYQGLNGKSVNFLLNFRGMLFIRTGMGNAESAQWDF